MKPSLFLAATLFLGGAILSHPAPTYAQNITQTVKSELAGMPLPPNTLRFERGAVPKEINDALQTMMQSGGPNVRRGRTEVIGWTGEGYKKSKVKDYKARIAAALKKAGWEYEEGEKIEGAEGATMASAVRTSPTRKALIGFWAPADEALVLAWTEMLPASSGNNGIVPPNTPGNIAVPDETEIAAPPVPIPVAAPRTGADTSPLLGVSVPRQGAASSDLDAPFASFLKSLAQDDEVKLSPSGPVEVWKWQGDAFRKDRIKFMQGAFQASLEKAGWNVKPFNNDNVRYVNTFDHFTDETSPNFQNLDTLGYFHAQSDAKGKAILGVWFSTNDTLALGMIPVQPKAPPKALPLPGAGAGLLVKDINDTGKSLPRRTMPKFPALARKPRTVRGYLKNSAGHPVVGGEVSVHVSAGGGFRTTHTGRSNAQGLYEVLLPAGVAEVVQVDTKVNYNGQNFTLALEPAGAQSTQFNATQGHVEHYLLKAQEGGAGGTIYVRGGLHEGIAEITIEPVARMLDGSTGQTLIYRFATNPSKNETYLNGMPLGRYKMTARLWAEGEALPLRVQNAFGYNKDTTLRSSLQLDFEPGFDYDRFNPGKSNGGVKQLAVSLAP